MPERINISLGSQNQGLLRDIRVETTRRFPSLWPAVLLLSKLGISFADGFSRIGDFSAR